MNCQNKRILTQRQWHDARTRKNATERFIDLLIDKPGPPRFARSTILVISSPNFVKLTLKKFGLAIKITPVSRAESLFLEGCMIN